MESINVLSVSADSEFLDEFSTDIPNESEFFNIISIQRVNEALELISSSNQRIDCVVSNCQFPDQDGLEFLKAVRGHDPVIPIIVFRNHEQEEIAADVLAAGATDYLQKENQEVADTLLATRIQAYVEQYHAEQTPARIYEGLEAATEGIGLIDNDGKYIYLNESYAEMYEYDRNELIGSHWERLYPDDETNRFREEILPGLKEKGTWSGYSQGVRASGERFTEKVSLTQLEGEGHICVIRDVTDRKQNEKQFETIAENLQGMVYRAENSPQWPIEFAHGNVEEFLGYTVSELESQNITWNEIIHPDDRNEVWDAVQEAVKASERFELTYRVIDTDGQTKWVTDRGTGVERADGTVTAVDGLITNVTDQKEHELELEWKSKAMDEAPMGIVISDPSREDNPLIYANNGFTEITGYTEDDILGRNCRILQGPLTDEAPLEEMRVAIDEREPVDVDLLNYRKNKTPFWNHVQVSPITDTDGTLTHFVGFQNDITSRVESERRVKVLHRVLRHNLRNNLNTVLGHLTLLQDNPSVSDETIEIIESSVMELLETSQKASQIQSRLQHISFQPESLDVEYVINSAISHGRSLDEDVDISTNIDSHLSVVASESITVAINELVENAITHSTETLPSITIGTETTTLSFQQEEPDVDAVTITIEDTNSVIPDIDLRPLLGEEESPVHHGSGLGMWLVNWVVTMSGGVIEHTKRDEGGNRISITLLQATD